MKQLSTMISVAGGGVRQMVERTETLALYSFRFPGRNPHKWQVMPVKIHESKHGTESEYFVENHIREFATLEEAKECIKREK